MRRLPTNRGRGADRACLELQVVSSSSRCVAMQGGQGLTLRDIACSRLPIDIDTQTLCRLSARVNNRLPGTTGSTFSRVSACILAG